jgi:DNA-directed RNA polymerase subunit RPC12/RpoP
MSSDELTAAKLKIAELQEKLDNAKTEKQETTAEQRLETALARFEVLEKRLSPKKAEEEDGDQCPECGGTLYEVRNGLYECSNCKQLWEEDEL